MRYFWLMLTLAAVTWYVVVTAYVAYKGVADIREMLQNLAARGRSDEADS